MFIFSTLVSPVIGRLLAVFRDARVLVASAGSCITNTLMRVIMFGVSACRITFITVAASVLSCGPISLPPARENLAVVVLDASKGSAANAEARCGVLAYELREALAANADNLRVVVLRTGGASGSPVLLGDAKFTPTRSGFAVAGSREAEIATVTTSLLTACRNNWKVEETTPLRTAVLVGIDTITAAEVAAKGRGHVLSASLLIASDLREEVEPRWRRAIRSPSPENLKALDDTKIVVPSVLRRLRVCDVDQTRDKLNSTLERDHVRTVFRRLVAPTEVMFEGACARDVTVASEEASTP